MNVSAKHKAQEGRKRTSIFQHRGKSTAVNRRDGTTNGAVSGSAQRQQRGSVAKESIGIRESPGEITTMEFFSRRWPLPPGGGKWNSNPARGIEIETATVIWKLLVGMR